MDNSIKDALAEAYATAPEIVIAHTLEFRHPAWIENGNRFAVRIVQGYENYRARLEASAPLDANQYVDFVAIPFDVTPPNSDGSATPTLSIEMDNIGREILEHIEKTTDSLDVIEVTYRPFIWDDAQAPARDPILNLEIKSIEVTLTRIKAVAGLRDLGSKSFPANVFTLANYPALAR